MPAFAVYGTHSEILLLHEARESLRWKKSYILQREIEIKILHKLKRETARLNQFVQYFGSYIIVYYFFPVNVKKDNGYTLNFTTVKELCPSPVKNGVTNGYRNSPPVEQNITGKTDTNLGSIHTQMAVLTYPNIYVLKIKLF